ncbi:hypothetical protein D9M72_520960 [compost metagenome]
MIDRHPGGQGTVEGFHLLFGLPALGLDAQGLKAEGHVVGGFTEQFQFPFTEGIRLLGADAQRAEDLAIYPQGQG